MQPNRLQLNADKTDLIWCATSRRLHRLQPTSIRVGSETILPSSTVRNLCVYIDSDLSMQSHVQWTVVGCFAALRQIRSVRRSRWRPLSCRSYWLGSTMVMQRWLAFRQTCCVVFRPCWMPLPGQSPIFHARRTSPRRWPVYTDFVQLSILSSSWRRWLIVVYTAQPPATSPLNYSCRRHFFSSASSFICHWRFTCPSDATCHCRWSGISGCGCQTLEWTSRRHHRFPVTGGFPSSA